jgi:DNA transformation protein and related proteins
MANSRDFVDHLLELARPAGAPTARAMFGGHGIYLDGLIVAIVIDDTLYLKCDVQSAAAFDARDLAPFEYVTKDGERIVMSYRRAPDEVLESPDAMREWLRLAQGAALRRATPRPATKARVPKAAKRTAR